MTMLTYAFLFLLGHCIGRLHQRRRDVRRERARNQALLQYPVMYVPPRRDKTQRGFERLLRDIQNAGPKRRRFRFEDENEAGAN